MALRLLVVTQAVDLDDPVLGFFHNWIAEFAKRSERIEVVCLKEGRHALPTTVRVHSLGKESGASKLKYIFRFYTYLWSLRNDYDVVLVHMNEEYVLLGGMVWKLFGTRIVLWRNHKVGTWRTTLAGRLADVVCHTSPQAYVSAMPNARVMPLGIDTELFSPGETLPDSILFLGRLDAVKKPDVFLEALQLLATNDSAVHADIYGDPTPGREAYADELKKRFSSLTNVTFHAGVSNDETPNLYRTHSIYVNTTPSGSFDKTIGEALACGCLVIAANNAVASVVGELFTKTGSAEEVAEALQRSVSMSETERTRFTERGREYVVKNHSLALLAERLFTTFV